MSRGVAAGRGLWPFVTCLSAPAAPASSLTPGVSFTLNRTKSSRAQGRGRRRPGRRLVYIKGPGRTGERGEGGNKRTSQTETDVQTPRTSRWLPGGRGRGRRGGAGREEDKSAVTGPARVGAAAPGAEAVALRRLRTGSRGTGVGGGRVPVVSYTDVYSGHSVPETKVALTVDCD